MDDSSAKVPSDNPNAYCRLCFSEHNLVSLFPKDDAPRMLLLQLISQIIGIEVTQGANIPSSICWRCAVALEDFQQFHHRSLAHDAIIQSMLSGGFEIHSVDEKIDWNAVALPTSDLPIEAAVAYDRIEQEDNQAEEPEHQTNDRLDETDLQCFKQTKTNAKSKSFVCHFKFCKKSFISKKLLYSHYKSQHSDRGRPFKCSICQAKFMRKIQLEEHAATHSTDINTRFTCLDCGNSYAQKRSLTTHRRRVHAYKPPKTLKTANTEGNKYKCRFCPKTFKHASSLHIHIKTHDDKLTVECDECDARFANEKGRIVHKGKHHPSNPSKVVPKDVHSCLYCPRLFRTRGNLKLHMRYTHLIEQDDQDSSEDTYSGVENSSDMGEIVQSTDNDEPLTIKLEVENDL